ncbi:MAG: deoxyribodipyrimidine photo-lyase [Halioglobus sp.]|jgi:deoxyribodipyrimidine photo-lyase
MKLKINVVWFKRDLRLSDHMPLKHAECSELPTLLLYVFEPMLLNDPHYSERHWRFVTESLTDMNRQLTEKITVAHGESVAIFKQINSRFHIESIFSYEETGLANTFARDKAISRWAIENSIDWKESASGAVTRPRANRDSWDEDWQQVMGSDLIANQTDKLKIIQGEFDTSKLSNTWKRVDRAMQRGGANEARRVLDDFFHARGRDYHWLIAKPLQSQLSCSRMSPYLAWGNISLRQMYQHLLSHWDRKGWRKPLSALSSRLHWHCHFIQKFESECSMEFEPINAGYRDMPYRDDARSEQDLVAWRTGNTGYPLVDACMRCLIKTGYLNFRMRAMLVSFLSHHLQIDWRRGVAHLASVFLDFEPGIHYTQFQMQAGVTGINTIRIYNPTKQAQEHDADGLFIRQWCPELESLPSEMLFEPWNVTAMEELMYGFVIGQNYPAPIVDTSLSYRQASEQLWAWQKRSDVETEAKRILRQHVRSR